MLSVKIKIKIYLLGQLKVALHKNTKGERIQISINQNPVYYVGFLSEHSQNRKCHRKLLKSTMNEQKNFDMDTLYRNSVI